MQSFKQIGTNCKRSSAHKRYPLSIYWGWKMTKFTIRKKLQKWFNNYIQTTCTFSYHEENICKYSKRSETVREAALTRGTHCLYKKKYIYYFRVKKKIVFFLFFFFFLFCFFFCFFFFFFCFFFFFVFFFFVFFFFFLFFFFLGLWKCNLRGQNWCLFIFDMSPIQSKILLASLFITMYLHPSTSLIFHPPVSVSTYWWQMPVPIDSIIGGSKVNVSCDATKMCDADTENIRAVFTLNNAKDSSAQTSWSKSESDAAFFGVWSGFTLFAVIHITKTCLFKYTENFTTKRNWKFSDKKFWYFSYFCSKHRLWVLVKTASTSGSNQYPQSILSRNKKKMYTPGGQKLYRCVFLMSNLQIHLLKI